MAGISITMISGQDGILTRTGNASVQSDIAKTKEQIDLELIGKYDNNGEYTNADVITAVKNATGKDVTEGDNTVITKNGNEINISDLWVTKKISKISIGEKINEKSEYTEKDTGYKITIPAGYTIHKDSSTKISEGIVIEDENKNEFVWVPVPNAIANSENEITTIVNSGKYPMAVTTGEKDSNGKTAYRGVLYNFSSSSGTISMTAMDYDATSGWREPAYLTDTNYGDASLDGIKYLQNIVGFTQSGEKLKTAWTNQMQNEFDDMVEKVASSGGYYISRYEMSGTINEDTGDISTESKPNSTAFRGDTSYKGDYFRWYGLYKAGKSYTHNGITSTMIWGSQYDQMLIWMTKSGIDIGQGNKEKSNKSSTITGVTGSQDIINNVYDIYGGRREWTLEAGDTNGRACKAGSNDNAYGPAGSSSNYPIGSDSYKRSSRLALHVE